MLRSKLGDFRFQFGARRDQPFRLDLGRQRLPCLASKEEGDAFGIGATWVRHASQHSVAIEPGLLGGELDRSADLWPQRHEDGVAERRSFGDEPRQELLA